MENKMKNEISKVIKKTLGSYKPIVLFSLFCFCITPLIFAAQDKKAQDIVRRSYELVRGDNSKNLVSMTIIKPTWSRRMEMTIWSLERQYQAIYFSKPKRDQGITFLRREAELWQWLPSIDRRIKLPPSMMMQSWMGSDFVTQDMFKEVEVTYDYEHKILGEEMVDGILCHKIVSIPLPEVGAIWGKMVRWFSVEHGFEWKQENYDENEELVRLITYSNIKKLKDRVIPTALEIIPLNKDKGNKTTLQYIEMNYDASLDKSFFSIQRLKKLRP